MISAYDPQTRDKTHLDATAAGECEEWLSWLLLEGKRPQTRIDYERTIAVLLKQNMGTPFAEFTPQQVMDTLTSYPRGSQRKVRAHLMSFFSWGVLVGRIDRNPRRWRGSEMPNLGTGTPPPARPCALASVYGAAITLVIAAQLGAVGLAVWAAAWATAAYRAGGRA